MANSKIDDVPNRKLLIKVLTLFKWPWFVFLAWIVIGGTTGEVLRWTGFIEPFCDMEGTSDTYAKCTPCKMHRSVFGVFETNNCPNAFVEKMLEYGIGIPRFLVAFLSILVYVFVEPLNPISRVLPALVLLPVSMAILFRTLFVNFFRHKNINRGVHRGLLAGWLVLAALVAVQW